MKRFWPNLALGLVAQPCPLGSPWASPSACPIVNGSYPVLCPAASLAQGPRDGDKERTGSQLRWRLRQDQDGDGIRGIPSRGAERVEAEIGGR